MSKKTIKPFLKWAGGKRWFTKEYSELFPNQYNRYLEPFLGAGAVFFHLQPKEPILGDSNKELINTYKAIRDNVDLVVRYLKTHHKRHSDEYYYKIRSSKPRSIYTKAATFIYLNRTCWNGLYRVNLKGEFNVPKGSKSKVLYDDDCFFEISKLLQRAELIHSDFENVINQSDEGDLLYVDPPYTVRHNNNGFIKYNEDLFSWEDQIRLKNALERARDRGVQIVGTNAYHNSLIELFEEGFTLRDVSRTSSISSKANGRNEFKELVILT